MELEYVGGRNRSYTLSDVKSGRLKIWMILA